MKRKLAQSRTDLTKCEQNYESAIVVNIYFDSKFSALKPDPKYENYQKTENC